MSEPAFVIVIPARHASVRLPGKVLRDIAGRSMLEHVWRVACRSRAAEVVVATDDERILDAVRGFGGEGLMTRADHASGSDRIAEVAQRRGWADATIIVNLQADEPEMPPACLDQVAGLLAGAPEAAVATLYWPIDAPAELANPNVVKVVVGARGDALYFSRAAVPHARDHAAPAAALRAGEPWCRHLGLYAYRHAALRRFANLAPTALEQRERLEQLRFLEHGLRIVIDRACQPIPAGVDTAEDLDRVRGSISSEFEN